MLQILVVVSAVMSLACVPSANAQPGCFSLPSFRLATWDERWGGVWPRSWAVFEYVCREFCRLTRQQIEQSMEATHDGFNFAVNELLLLGCCWCWCCCVLLRKSYCSHLKKFVIQVGVEELLAALRASQQFEAELADTTTDDSGELDERGMPRGRPEFDGVLTDCFEPYLERLYVGEEERKLGRRREKFSREESWRRPPSVGDEHQSLCVLGSATSLV